MQSHMTRSKSCKFWRYATALFSACFAALMYELPAHAQQLGPLVLAKATEAVPGKRIGWNFDDIRDVLTNADADGKPVIAVMIADRCSWCRIFLAHVLRCDGLNSFAGKAHFIILHASERDDERKQFMNLLKVEGYPTTAIVSVRNKTITPIGKIAGASSETGIIRLLAAAGVTAGSVNPPSTQNAAIGLPRPAACGSNTPDANLMLSSPVTLQQGISP